MDLSFFPALAEALRAFQANGQVGQDPVAALYPERRKRHSLFSNLLTDAEMEGLRSYVFGYGKIPQKPDDAVPRVLNLVNGQWTLPAKGEFATMKSPADRRIPLFQMPASTQADVEAVVSAADAYWKS